MTTTKQKSNSPEVSRAINSVSELVPELRDFDVSDSEQMTAFLTAHPDAAERVMQALFDLNLVPRPIIEPQHANMAARILEATQFDGDNPQYRRHPLQEGMTPAVPVYTETASAVALGLEIEQASDDMLSQIIGMRTAYFDDLYAKHGTLDPAVIGDVPNPPEPDHYRTGYAAQKVQAKPIPTDVLLLLSAEQKQAAAWRTLSTSQGRYSATPVVATLTRQELNKRGVRCEVVETLPATATQVATHTWSVNITGKGNLQQSFDPIGQAAIVLAARMCQDLAHTGLLYYLFLEPVNNIADREVGWLAVLFTWTEM